RRRLAAMNPCKGRRPGCSYKARCGSDTSPQARECKCRRTATRFPGPGCPEGSGSDQDRDTKPWVYSSKSDHGRESARNVRPSHSCDACDLRAARGFRTDEVRAGNQNADVRDLADRNLALKAGEG